jgi:polyferredoxin
VTGTWHQLRSRIQLVCFLIFLVLPFVNVIRFDIPGQRFYFFGQELWISEFGIIFFALMFLMFVVVLMSVFLGRVFCGYLCPQMMFSEAAMWIQKRLKRYPKPVFYLAVAGGSVLLAIIFICYFVEPRQLTFGVSTAGGICGAAVTLIAFLDFGFVRQKFCTSVCPYGYLQGLLADHHTLLVQYQDPNSTCIECKKCIRVCPMEIDIRKSPFQIECIHCGECIDACDQIMTRLKKPSLIHYTRGGWRDAKRVVVLAVLLFYATGLIAALAMRHQVLVRIAPMREHLYRVGEDGRIYNRFRYQIDNRSRKPGRVVFSIQQLPGASLALPGNPVSIGPGQFAQGEFEISRPLGRRDELVSHFRIVTATVPGGESDEFPMTFLSPGEDK